MNGVPASVLSAALAIQITTLFAPFLEKDSREGRRGNERYAAGDWEGAMQHYAEAASGAKDGTHAYNLGTAATKKKDYAAATRAFERAMADARLDRGQVAYNMGNARFQAGDLQSALAAYRAALRAHPEDADARANYELTLRELQSPQNQNQPQQQPGEQNQQGDQSQQNQQNQNQQQNQQQNEQSQQNQREGQEKQEQAENKPEPGNQNPNQDRRDSANDSSMAQPRELGQMSSEEAKRLLNAVTPKERELLEARLKPSRRHRAEKDW